MLRTRCGVIVVAAVLAGSACSGGDRDGAPPGGDILSERDSAGVRIVELDAGILEQLPLYRIADSPSVVVGDLDGEEPYLFTRIAQAFALPEGGTAIFDGHTSQTRFFDAEGRWVRSVGRVGEGPGEFSPAVMGGTVVVGVLPDGGVAVHDASRRRVTLFDPQGRVAEEWSRDPEVCRAMVRGSERTPFCSVTGFFADGSLALVDRESVEPSAFADSDVIDDLFLRVYREERGELHELAAVPLPSVRIYSATAPNGTVRKFANPPLLTRAATVAIGQDRVLILSSERYELLEYALDGSLRQIVRIVAEPVPFSEEERSRFLEGTTATRVPAGVATHRPTAAAALIGVDGTAWVLDWKTSMLDGEAPPRYTVFGRDGIPVARVIHPRGKVFQDQGVSPFFTPRLGLEAVRLVTLDEYEVPRLLIFELVPVEPEPS